MQANDLQAKNHFQAIQETYFQLKTPSSNIKILTKTRRRRRRRRRRSKSAKHL
jgi:hypothetical protein